MPCAPRQQELVVARAYEVERPAHPRARRREALALFRHLHRRPDRPRNPAGHPPPDLPWSGYLGVDYAALQITSDAIDTAAEPDLAVLEDDLQPWVADLARVR